MIKSVFISKIITRHCIFLALKAAEHELKAYARAHKIPIIAGVTAGGIIAWLLSSSVVGALIGGLLGALVIHSHRRHGYSKPAIK